MHDHSHDADPLSWLTAQIERITFSNEENGFTIARVKVTERSQLVTVVGSMMAPLPGEILKLRGRWKMHPRFGEQFHFVEYRSAEPATIHGIKKYLSSGLIPGLGPKIAERIVTCFGEKTLTVIDEDPLRLKIVPGVGKKRIELIRSAWEAQQEIRKVMLFLQTHDVSSGYAAKIFKTYGKDAIAVVRQNPYRLAADIYGIGFVTADAIATKLGMEKENHLRVAAGILYVLNQLAEEGHLYYPYEPLVQKCIQILSVPRDVVVTALAIIAAEDRVVLEDLNENLSEFVVNHKAVYLSKFHFCETWITRRLLTLLSAPGTLPKVNVNQAVNWVQERLGMQLAPGQIRALGVSLTQKVMLLTGGPGTGKTTIINAILKIFQRHRAVCLLAAPTGRAAKRMAETTGHPAKTIHRLLEYAFVKGGFQKNETRPLKCDLLVVDETSMLDTVLAHHLLKAVPINAVLILVGDVHQLPSVGPGNVLADIITSKRVPVVELDQIFRQAKMSRIIVNAHRINQGRLPLERSDVRAGEKQDFYFIEQDDPERMLKIIIALVTDRIPRRFGLDPIDDIQVLTPMYRGVIGAGNLNRQLQEALNRDDREIHRGERIYRVGDKIMQVRNNYDKDIYNGDIGRIRYLDEEVKQLDVDVEGRKVVYDFNELDELVPAYAISVHKSQGSEYPAVVMPVHMQHYLLLQRNLVYTAVTRGRALVVLVGSRKALAMAVKNDRPKQRYTYLWRRLMEES